MLTAPLILLNACHPFSCGLAAQGFLLPLTPILSNSLIGLRYCMVGGDSGFFANTTSNNNGALSPLYDIDSSTNSSISKDSPIDGHIRQLEITKWAYRHPLSLILNHE
ncbi:hypothetical protein E2C01_021663 [Portunus trituberculatus]|uniref:Uncharacterized protein n=1 Tax=Portunus trituberculatus TaxID=210409 RepID=A0A5B7E5I4_PORTR|nr:hypothetical protein [Portunus trituberculatus]